MKKISFVNFEWKRGSTRYCGLFKMLAFLLCAGFSNECVRAVSLGEALDATNLVWTTGGDGDWGGQTILTFDGVDAARTPALSDGQSSWIQTTVTGPGTFSFWAKNSASKAQTSFECYYDNAMILSLNYFPWDWRKRTIQIEAGTHTLRWVFREGYCLGYPICYQQRTVDYGQIDQIIWVPSIYTNTQPPVIQAQPSNRSSAVGTEARFHVFADGAQPLNYQWKFNGSNILIGTDMTLTLRDVQLSDLGSYSVEVSNTYGTVTSQSATLAVAVAPLATLTPSSPVIETGDALAFTATASGTAPISYQWRFQGHDIPDATGTSLLITNAQPTAAGTYSVVITNSVGSVTLSAPLFISSCHLGEALDATNLVWRSSTSEGFPTWFGQTNTNLAGDAAQTGGGEFSPSGWIETDVTGPGNLSFVWRVQAWALNEYFSTDYGFLNYLLDGTEQNIRLSGNAGDTGWRSNIVSIPNGTHTVRWEYGGDVRSGFAAWVDQVQYPDDSPKILVQPRSFDVIAGDIAGNSVRFEVGAVGHDLTFQWRFNADSITGATNADYVINSVQLSDAGLYSVTVSNAFGVTNSLDAILSVRGVPPRILTQPNDYSAEVGSSLSYGTLSAEVGGSGPMTHRWMFNQATALAENIGMSRYLFPNLTNVQFSHAGTYQLLITNEFGITNSVPSVLTVVPTLADALDTTNWTWSRPSSSGWRSQTLITHDGADAAHSSGSYSKMETTVMGPKVMTFQFRNGESNSSLRVEVDNLNQWWFDGVSDWKEGSVQIPDGNRKITIYASQLVWLDEITLTPAVPPSIVTQPQNRSVVQGGEVEFSVNAVGSAPLRYQWFFCNTLIPGATGSVYSKSNVQPIDTGRYFASVANAFGSHVSSDALLSVNHLVTTSAVGDGNISPSPDVLVTAGGQYTFTATPFQNQTPGEWYTNGSRAQVGGTQFTLSNILTNCTVEVVFRPLIRLYWQHTNGSIAEWHLNGTNFLTSVSLSAINPVWRMVGQFDSNADCQFDFLFQHIDGRLLLRTMEGTSVARQSLVGNGRKVPVGWRMKALSDLDSDGETDFLLQTSSNSLSAWFINNGTNLLSRAFMKSHNSGWRVVGAADFNGDNQKDILWQNAAGVIAVWFMDGATKVGGVALRNGQAAANWKASALADLDFNGQDDILLRNGKGRVAVWLMNGTNHWETVLLRNGRTSGLGWRLLGPK